VFVYLSPRADLRNHTYYFRHFCACCPWPWLGLSNHEDAVLRRLRLRRRAAPRDAVRGVSSRCGARIRCEQGLINLCIVAYVVPMYRRCPYVYWLVEMHMPVEPIRCDRSRFFRRKSRMYRPYLAHFRRFPVSGLSLQQTLQRQ